MEISKTYRAKALSNFSRFFFIVRNMFSGIVVVPGRPLQILTKVHGYNIFFDTPYNQIKTLISLILHKNLVKIDCKLQFRFSKTLTAWR